MAGNEPVDPAALTQCGATELGVAIPETGPQLAYSAEMEALDYPEPVSKARVALIAGSIVAVAGLVAGVVLFVGWNRRETTAPVAASTTQTTSAAPLQLGASAPPAPPPPPVTITTVIVQAPPPAISTKAAPPTTPAAPQWVSIYDQQLFNRLTGQGIAIQDYASMARDAHLVCARLSNGRSVAAVTDEYAQASRGNYVIAQVFIGDVMAIYPSCP